MDLESINAEIHEHENLHSILWQEVQSVEAEVAPAIARLESVRQRWYGIFQHLETLKHIREKLENDKAMEEADGPARK